MSDSMAPVRARNGLGRRELLAGAGAALAGLALTPPGQSLGRSALSALPGVGSGTSSFERPEIAARIGDTFKVAGGLAAGTVLSIDNVVAIPHQSAATDLQFAVRFAQTSGIELAEGLYTFKNSTFGDVPLYVSRIEGTESATHEAIIDRFVPGQQGATP